MFFCLPGSKPLINKVDGGNKASRQVNAVENVIIINQQLQNENERCNYFLGVNHAKNRENNLPFRSSILLLVAPHKANNLVCNSCNVILKQPTD